MAIDKKAAVTTPGSEAPAKVTFYFPVATLFASISARSMMVAEKINNTDGNPAIDEYGISDDEQELIETVYLRNAFNAVFGLLDKLTFGLISTDLYNTTYTDSASENKGVCIAKTILDKKGYQTDSLNAIDNLLEEMIKAHILNAWFKNCSLANQALEFENEFLKAKKDFLIKRTKLYKPSLT